MTTYHLRGTDGTEVFTGTIQPPPGGGSQPGASYVVGPYTVTHADLPTTGSHKNLFTIPAGHKLLTWWSDADTYVSWTVQQSVAIGQGPAFVSSSGLDGLLGFSDSAQSPCDGQTQAADGNRIGIGGLTGCETSLLVPQSTDPVQVYGTADQAAGSVDLYFLLCTAPAVI